MGRKFAVSLILVSLVSGSVSACGSDAGEAADGNNEMHDHHPSTEGDDAGGGNGEEGQDGDDTGADGTGQDEEQGDGGAGANHPDGKPDAGGVVVDAGSSGNPAQPPPALNGCTSYVDRTAPGASRTLDWDYGIESDPERCIKVKVGQIVKFDGDIVDHPIDARGGTTPNPFKGALDSKASFAFPKAGGFGFYCFIHEEMNGAVWVVE